MVASGSYARRSPVGRPASGRVQGLADWQAGLTDRALRHWQAGSEDASRLKMPVEAGLLHYELGRHLGHVLPVRLDHLRQAAEVFRGIDAKYYLERTLAEINRHC